MFLDILCHKSSSVFGFFQDTNEKWKSPEKVAFPERERERERRMKLTFSCKNGKKRGTKFNLKKNLPPPYLPSLQTP